MGRSSTKPSQIPGAPAGDTPDDADTGAQGAGLGDDSPDVGTDPSEGETKFVTTKGRKATHEEKDARIAELEAKLAAAQAAPKLPQVVFEPKTPHGKAALAASDTAEFTVAQVMAKIDAGELREPLNNCLCSDGYYVRRGL